MLTATELFFIGAAWMVVLLVLVEAIAKIAHSSFVATVILGKDNRTSTSKTFVFMWTLLVGWAIACLLIAGELIKIHGCAAIPDIKTAITACTAQHDQVGLLQTGWQQFVSDGLSGGYLVLLGAPAAAAIAAKAITQAKIESGTDPKPAAAGTQTLSARVAQIFSADDQSTDIGDFQYMLFNLVTAVYFVAQFVHPSGDGLPAMPDTLLGLTSVSAALYVGKKAVTKNQPTITGVFPSILRPDHQITVTGSGLTAEPNVQTPSPGRTAPQITINGIEALEVKPDPAVADRLTGIVPPNVVPAGTQSPVPGTLQVLSAYGAITNGYEVQLRDQ